MNYLEPDKGIKVFDIQFDKQTAGPSPNDNKRIELFLLGCDKAMNGFPCKGCFNQPLWDSNKAQHSLDPIELANWIIERTPENERYITLGGGEPLLNIETIIPLCKHLKDNGFHIMMYTWRMLRFYLKESKDITEDLIMAPNSNKVKERLPQLLPYLDIIVDGQYKQEERLYQDNCADGFLSSIGSGNQYVWDIKHYNKFGTYRYYAMKDIKALKVSEIDDSLIIYLKEGVNACAGN
jgi:organic radical activating enzyme